jgi:hypothetical protein
LEPKVLGLVHWHFALLFPIILFQFLASSALHGVLPPLNPLVKWLLNLSGTRQTLESWYKGSLWSLMVLVPILEGAKGYIMKEHSPRPQIFDPMMRHLIKHHYVFNAVLMGLQFLLNMDFTVI